MEGLFSKLVSVLVVAVALGLAVMGVVALVKALEPTSAPKEVLTTVVETKTDVLCSDSEYRGRVCTHHPKGKVILDEGEVWLKGQWKPGTSMRVKYTIGRITGLISVDEFEKEPPSVYTSTKTR